ncbi:MAG: YggT family protein [Spirochaetia bacterium]|jgi:YggT family protein|nr:YggT family protein [Spirochaetia bacterium]
MDLLLRVITGLLSGYMLLLFIRIIITWFSSSNFGKPFEILKSITDPYLNYFRQFTFLKFGMMDFSSIAGILLLVILLNILNTIASYGSITFGLILAIVLGAAWSAINFLLTFFIILTLIRLVTGMLNATKQSPLMTTIETIISPVTNFVYNKIFKTKNITYTTCLAVTGTILIVLLISGNAITSYLAKFLGNLSF